MFYENICSLWAEPDVAGHAALIIRRLMPSPDGGDDCVGVGSPGEGLGFGVGLTHEAVGGGLKVDDGVKDAALEPSPGEFREEALDGIEPRAGGRHEVEGPARMSTPPSTRLPGAAWRGWRHPVDPP